jgi:Sulfotransferase family
VSRADSPLRDRMIFNVGARRSGTFWLQRIVTAHPDVDAVGAETHFISHGIAPLLGMFSSGLKSTPQVGQIWMERADLIEATRDFCDRVFLAQFETDARYLAERTPVHVLHLDLIGELYPDARVVHIIRDGRDVARSLMTKSWGADSIDVAAREWRGSVLAGREAAFPGTYIEVFYERLLADPESEIRRLFEQLGLSTSDDAVAAAVGEAKETVNVDQSMPSVKAEKWREALSADELRAFEEIAGDLLEQLGYERGARVRLPRLRRKKGVESAPPPAESAPAEGAGPLPPERPAREGTGARMAIDVLDSLLAAVAANDGSRAGDLLTTGATVRTVAGDSEREHGDAEARDALAQILSEDVALQGRQRRADVYVQPSGLAAVVEYELPDGSRAERIFVLDAEGERIARLVVYQLPPRPPSGR